MLHHLSYHSIVLLLLIGSTVCCWRPKDISIQYFPNDFFIAIPVDGKISPGHRFVRAFGHVITERLRLFYNPEKLISR